MRRLMLFFLGVLLLTAGCNQPAPTQHQQQVLIWPNVGVTDLPQLDPAFANDDNSEQAVELIFSGLVKLNQQLQIVSDAASSWQVSPDGKTYTFTLADQLRFGNGAPVTSQDVVYSLNRSLQMNAAAEQEGGVGGLFYLGHIVGAADVAAGRASSASGLKAINAQTVQIQLDEPIAYFLADLAAPQTFLVPQALIQQYGEQKWVEHAVGTGPFVLGRWTHGVRLTFTPNSYYVGARPVVHEVDMPFAQDPHAALLAYRAGQYDLTWGLAAEDYAEARTEKNYHETVMLGTDTLVPNTTIAPFNAPAVRQAFAEALNVQTLAHQVMGDSVVAATTIVPPGLPGYDTSSIKGLGTNTQEAQKLLQTVYPDVKMMPPVTLTYPVDGLPQAEAQAMQVMWQQVLGVQVDLAPVDPSTYARESAAGQVQLGVVNWMPEIADPWNFLSVSLHSGATENVGAWTNMQFDQLVDQADQTYNDPTQRILLYQQAEQLALTDGAWIPLDHPKFTAFIAQYVHGLVVTPVGLMAPDWSKVTVSAH